jgi:hypothetical protein
MDRRVRLALSVAPAAAAVVLALAAVQQALSRDLEDVHWRIAVTTWGALLCAGALLAGVRMLERERRSPFGWTSVALPLPALILFAVAAWSESVWDRWGETFGKTVLTAFFLLVSAIVLTTLRLLSDTRQPVVRWLVVAVTALVVVANAVWLGSLWPTSPDEVGDSERVETGARWLVAIFALVVAGYVATPLVDRALRERHRDRLP